MKQWKRLNLYFIPVNIHPDQIYYKEIDKIIKIEFRNSKKKRSKQHHSNLSAMNWLAPELLQKDTQPVS